MILACSILIAVYHAQDVSVRLVTRSSGRYWEGKETGGRKVAWRFPFRPSYAWASRSPDGNTFALPVPENDIVCIGAPGRVRWRHRLDNLAEPTALVALDSYIVVGLGTGTVTTASREQSDERFRVSVLDADFGTPVWSEPLRRVGRPIAAVTSDEFVSVFFVSGRARHIAVWSVPFRSQVNQWLCDAATAKALQPLYSMEGAYAKARYDEGNLSLRIYPSRRARRGSHIKLSQGS